MKKIIALTLAILMMAVCLTACTPNHATLDSVKKAGKLVIATSPDFPPFEEKQADGSVTGIEIDILKLICKELGVELVIEEMNFDSVIPGIQAGKYDVGVSGISVTPEREKHMLFSNPYCMAAQSIVVVEGSTITKKADLEGKKISVQDGTTAATFCADQGYEITSFKANNDAQTELVSGRVDAWVIDDLTAAEMVAAYNAKNPEKKLVILDQNMTEEPYAFAFNLGSQDLVDEINKILDKLIADGTIKALFEKYNAPYTAPKK